MALATEWVTFESLVFTNINILDMIQVKKIEDTLLHLVGFDQGGTSNVKVSKALTQSESGLYFQQAHPLITLSNLSSIAPDYANIESAIEATADYRENTEYVKGSIVFYAGKYYRAEADGAKSSDFNTDSWSEVDPFSIWLEKKVRASVTKVVTRFVNEKLSNKTSNSLCENKTLFDGTGRLADTITNHKNLVGFEITPIRSKGITTRINKVCLQFTTPGVYKLYLMHSSSFTPIKTIEVEKKIKGSEWIKLDDVLLPYESENTNAGGSWYLCYKQSELPEGSKAINKDKDWSKGPCQSCSRSEYASWSAWSKFIEVHPFEVKEDEAEDLDGSIMMWDIENNNYQYNRNYGLNLDISVYCDLTEFIIKERHLFQDVIMKQFAVDMLREFAYNPSVRTNRHSINASRMDILYEIDGDSASMKKSGLNYQLDQAMKAIDISTQGIDRICLTCRNNGIKYKTV